MPARPVDPVRRATPGSSSPVSPGTRYRTRGPRNHSRSSRDRAQSVTFTPSHLPCSQPQRQALDFLSSFATETRLPSRCQHQQRSESERRMPRFDTGTILPRRLPRAPSCVAALARRQSSRCSSHFARHICTARGEPADATCSGRRSHACNRGAWARPGPLEQNRRGYSILCLLTGWHPFIASHLEPQHAG